MSFIVGQVAMGENFWNREYEIEDIWDVVEERGHILLSAPRRIGKTSIMRKIESEPKDGYYVIYLDTESADSENEFWAKVYHALTKEEFINQLKLKAKTIYESIKNIKIKKLSLGGVEFGDGKIIDYKNVVNDILNSFDASLKIIIMFDEFAQTVENIIKFEDEKNALSLLKSHHTLRQDKNITDKVNFIYAGSIGLESVVKKINGTKYINDLNSIKISPLEHEDAKNFIKHLLDKNKFEMDDECINYLLEEIKWLIPFYIQLILQESKKISKRERRSVTNELIDKAIQKAIEHRNFFDHWQVKLKEAFKKDEYLFAKEVLNTISNNNKISSNEIYNLSSKHSLDEDNAREIIHSLDYDGYINNNDNVKEFVFNSPILKIWWYKNVAN